MIIAALLGVIGAYTLYVMPGVSEKLYIKQLIGVAGGMFLAMFVSVFDYRFLAKFFVPMYLLNLVLLAAVKFTRFGVTIYGAKRWLGYNDLFAFQPSELSKVIMIIVMAKLYQILEPRLKKFYILLIMGAIFGVQWVLILIEPDLSTSIVFALLFVIMLFASGYNLKVILSLGVLAVPIIIFGFWYVQQPDPMFITHNQQTRILAYLHPEDYPDVIYQQMNSISAISSGGLLGKQLTNNTGPRGTAYVPVKESDFIFTGICEEFGFLGAVLVILLFLIMALIIVKIAYNSTDLLGRLSAVGCACVFTSQMFVNIGVVTLLLPNTGIPLPFVSNGLSSVMSSYIMLGIVQNISVNHDVALKKESEEYIK
jgi:rod shape determining protein RodA